MKHILRLILICLMVLFASFVVAQEKQSSDFFLITVKGKKRFIDKTGKIIIKPQFRSVRDFAEGLAPAALDNENYRFGYIDESGKFVISRQFDLARKFSEGLAAVGFGKFEMHGGGDHKFGFIDKTGKIIIEPDFRKAHDFSEGLAAIMNEERKWGYIDKTGKLVIPFQFEDAFDFSEDLACVLIDGLFGFIDKSGKVVIDPQFSLPSQFKEGLAGVRIGDKNNKPYKGRLGYIAPYGKQLFIDKTGKIVLEFGDYVRELGNFSDGLALIKVERNGLFSVGFIDKTGKIVIEPVYSDYTQDFSEGLALVKYKDKIGFIDRTGKMVIKPEYSFALDFQNGLAKVVKGKDVFDENAKKFYIDKTGKIIWQSKEQIFY